MTRASGQTEPRGDGDEPAPSTDGGSPVVGRNLLVLFSVTLIAIMGVASITPAIPTAGEQLHVDPARIGLLITVFTLPGVVLTPLLGVLADRWGRKRVLVPSLVLFALAGTSCTAAPGFATLLVLRFVQGLGAAALGALNVTLIGDLYEGQRRAAAMGYNASVLSLGTAAYPAVGGALALLGWRYPFLLPILALPVALAVIAVLDTPRRQPTGKLSEYLRGALRSMKRRTVLGLLFASIATFVILYGAYLTYLPLRMRSHFGSSSFVIGIVMSSASLTTALVSSQLGRLTRRFPQRRLVQTGFGLYAVSLALVPPIDGPWWMLVPAVVFGVAQAINIPTIMNVLASLAPTEYRAGFMSVNGMVLRGGQTLGPVIMGGAYALWGPTAPFYAGIAVALGSLGLLFAALGPDAA